MFFRLYQAGINFNPLSLYPQVRMPVPRGTPMLSPLVHWDHSQTWGVPTLEQLMAGGGGAGASCVYEVELGTDSPGNHLYSTYRGTVEDAIVKEV